MKIIIKTKGNVKVSEAVKEHIENQASHLDRMFNKSENVNINVLCIEKNEKYTCEITIVLKHIILRAECKGDTLYAAIDQAMDKVEQQLIKHKRKVNDIIKRREGVSEYFAEAQKEEPEQKEELIRVKKIDVMEMSIDDAITQMELLDHEFFLFKNEESHTMAVVYKRKNGGYGLVESLE